MARTLPLYDHLVDEDYIDLDISPITFLCYSMSSPPHSREFEFQVSTNPRDGEATTFPADELFYKGKLLPLHLPPRLQMVQKLLQSSTTPPHAEFPEAFEEKMTTTPTAAAAAAAASTPFESCSISPDASYCVPGELNSENCCFECSSGLVQSKPKKSWSQRLKLVRQSSLGLRLKASRAYLRSLFTKSGCADESCAVHKAKECSNGYVMAGEKDPFGRIKSMDGGKPNEEERGHRKSLSGIIRWNSTMKSSSCSSSSSSSFSSFSSANSNGYHQPQTLRRSSSVNSEVESSIQGAIAYCKKSQQVVCARKSVSDVEFCSSSASRISAACENQERPGLCRG